MSIFISAHGCKLEKKFNLDNSTLFFEAKDGDSCINYFEHSLDMNTKNYKYEVTQGHQEDVHDYAIVFYWDYMDTMDKYEFSKKGIGIFYPNEQNEYVNLLPLGQIIGSKGKVFLLSDIINYFNKFDYYSFYLSICRADCDDVFNNPKFEFSDFKTYLELPYDPTDFDISEQSLYNDEKGNDLFSPDLNMGIGDPVNTNIDSNIFEYNSNMYVDQSNLDNDPNRPLFTNADLSNDDYIFNDYHPNSGGKYSKKKKKRKRTKKRITKRRNKKRRTVKKKKNYKKKKN